MKIQKIKTIKILDFDAVSLSFTLDSQCFGRCTIRRVIEHLDHARINFFFSRKPLNY